MERGCTRAGSPHSTPLLQVVTVPPLRVEIPAAAAVTQLLLRVALTPRTVLPLFPLRGLFLLRVEVTV